MTSQEPFTPFNTFLINFVFLITIVVVVIIIAGLVFVMTGGNQFIVAAICYLLAITMFIPLVGTIFVLIVEFFFCYP